MAIELDTTNTYASIAAMREVANKLAARLNDTATVFEGKGTVGIAKNAPLITVSEGGKVVALITMAALPNEWQNVLGLPQTSYSPHAVKVAFAEGDGAAVDPITARTRYTVLGQVFALGAKVEVFSDEAVDETTFADTPEFEWFPDAYWGPNASV